MISPKTLGQSGKTIGGLGFLALLVDVVLGFQPARTESATLIEGVPFERRSPAIALVPVSITPALGPRGDLQGITARVTTPGGEEHAFTGQSPARIDDYELRTSSVGLAPQLAVGTAGGERTVRPPIPLGVWRPDGGERSFRLPDVAATAWARYYPDFELGPNGPGTSSMFERNPVLHVRLVPDFPGGPSGQALFRVGDAFVFGDVTLELVALRHWGDVTLTRLRPHYAAWIGLALIALGALAHLTARTLGREDDPATGES